MASANGKRGLKKFSSLEEVKSLLSSPEDSLRTTTPYRVEVRSSTVYPRGIWRIRGSHWSMLNPVTANSISVSTVLLPATHSAAITPAAIAVSVGQHIITRQFTAY